MIGSSAVSYNRIQTLSEHFLQPSLSAGPKKTVVTLIGGGNSAHVCCGLFEENSRGSVSTQLLTSVPELFEKNGNKIVVEFPSTGSQPSITQTGRIDKVSSNPADLIPDSDIVLWTGPVHQTKNVFEKMIKPHLSSTKKTYIGTIFGQGLVHVSAMRAFGTDAKFFALRNIPWLCRTIEKGRACAIVGPKSSIEVRTINIDEKWVFDTLEPLFVVQKMRKYEPKINLLPNFCPIVFNPANQIIHPAVYWGHFRRYDGRGIAPDAKLKPGEWLYRDMDETAGQCLLTLDEELQGIKDAYQEVTGAPGCDSVVPLADRLLTQYGDQIADKSSMGKMVSTNKAYSMAKTPMQKDNAGYIHPFPTHRVVQDDIGWGLCVLLSIAERLETVLGRKIPVHQTRMCVEWHQEIMNKEFLVNGKLTGKDCDELVLIGPNDSLDIVAGVADGKNKFATVPRSPQDDALPQVGSSPIATNKGEYARVSGFPQNPVKLSL